jgi:hypothetical protein
VRERDRGGSSRSEVRERQRGEVREQKGDSRRREEG